MLNKKRVLFSVLFILSLFMNFFFLITINNSSVTGKAITNQFHFINPYENQPIDSDSNSQELIIHYLDLKKIVIEKIKENNLEENVAVFLQDIKTGAWMGINEKEEFASASLYKIPIMIGILKKVDREEFKLKDKIIIIPSDADVRTGNFYKKVGSEVSVQELLKAMIISSDNTAKNTLERQLSPVELNSVFTHVGIKNPYIQISPPHVSPRAYTRFFKTLYYSTYLSPKLSELALDLTTDTEEENLISKGIPVEVQVAHKFGIYSEENSLHDCGIVYHYKKPYFLCIMTKDLELSKSSELIPELSRIVFEFVDAQ